MRERAYINVSGATLNSNKTSGSFDINAPQYTSYYKQNRTLSVLPVQAHFNSSKYKSKKPIPSNNTYVSFEGFLEDVQTDSYGRATMFHVSVDNINFLGRSSLSPSATGNPSQVTPSFSNSLFNTYLQHPPPRPALRVSNSILTLLPALPRTVQFQNLPLQ